MGVKGYEFGRVERYAGTGDAGASSAGARMGNRAGAIEHRWLDHGEFRAVRQGSHRRQAHHSGSTVRAVTAGWGQRRRLSQPESVSNHSFRPWVARVRTRAAGCIGKIAALNSAGLRSRGYLALRGGGQPVCWRFAGGLLAVCWRFAGGVLAVCWKMGRWKMEQPD